MAWDMDKVIAEAEQTARELLGALSAQERARVRKIVEPLIMEGWGGGDVALPARRDVVGRLFDDSKVVTGGRAVLFH